MSMRDYLSKMKGYIDLLAACGHPISEDDQIMHIIGGVGLEYDSVVVHVTSRIDTLSISEVGALLQSHEGRIEAYNTSIDGTSSTVNAVVVSHPKKITTDNSPQGEPYRERGRGRNFRG